MENGGLRRVWEDEPFADVIFSHQRDARKEPLRHVHMHPRINVTGVPFSTV